MDRRSQKKAVENTSYRDSEVLYQALFEQATDGLFIADERGNYVDVNQHGCEMLGYTREEILNLSLQDLIPAEDLAHDPLQLDELRAGKALLKERRLRCKDDHLLPVEISARVLTDGSFLGMVRDITAHKQAVMSLRESEAKYRLLAENAQDMIYRMSLPDGIYEYVSPASVQLFGYTPEEFYDNPLLIQKAIHPDWQTYFAEEWEKLLTGQMPPTYEYQIIHKSGEMRWLYQRNVLSVDDDQKPIAIEGVVTDITARKRAEERLRLLTRAVEQSADSIIITDTEGNIEYVNPKFTALTGYSSDEVMGKNPRILKSGWTSPEEYVRLWQTITAGGEWRGEFHNKKKDGTLYWEAVSISPVRDEAGTITHFVAVKEDITDRKHAEQALAEERNLLRTLIDNMPDAIYVKDTSSQFLVANNAVAHMMGTTPEELIGKTDFDFYPEGLAYQFFADEQTVIKIGQALVDKEEIIINHAGETRWYSTTKVAFRDSQGRIKGIVGIGRDITRRREMEEALRQAHDELEARVQQRTAELARANEQLTTLYEVGQTIAAPLQLRVVLDAIARSTVELVGTDTGVILLLDEAEETLTIQGAYGLSERVVRDTCDQVGESIAGRVVQTGQPIIANDLPNDPRFHNPAADDEGLLACASVPLFVGEKTIGTLDVHSKTERQAFDDRHIHTLNMLANQAAIAIENARLYEALQSAHDQLEERVQRRTTELKTANKQLQEEIAERKQAEETLRANERKLQLIIQNMPVMMDAFDADGNILVWNRECERITGYREDEIVSNPKAMELLYPDASYRERMTKEWAERGNDYYHWEWDITTKDGSVKTISWSNIADRFPISDWATWGLGVDITAHKQAEQRQLQLALEKERGETFRTLMSNIAHDLKTPLAIINASLYLLEKHLDPARRQEKVDIIKGQVRVLDSFIQDLLALARLDSEPQLRLMPVDVNELVMDLEADHHDIIAQKRLTFSLDLEETLLPIQADQTDLRRALANLVENAIQYTPEKGSVTVRTYKQINEVILEIMDTGIGIGEDALPHIFDRFYRSTEAQALTGSGSGLGLAIVERVIEMHGGTVEVDSVLGEGTRFRVLLHT